MNPTRINSSRCTDLKTSSSVAVAHPVNNQSEPLGSSTSWHTTPPAARAILVVLRILVNAVSSFTISRLSVEILCKTRRFQLERGNRCS
jgi:hypothetical protein